MTEKSITAIIQRLTDQENLTLLERFCKTGHLAPLANRQVINIPGQYEPVATEILRPGRTVRHQHVLGIWPDPIICSGEDMAVVFDKWKLDYVALRGRMATLYGVYQELERAQYGIVDVIAHGSADGIKLYDDFTDPGWWGALARNAKVPIWVLMASESSWPACFNVADAIFANGVQAVISVDSQISDKEVVIFRSMLYCALTPKRSIAEAVSIARQVVSRATAESIRLRVR